MGNIFGTYDTQLLYDWTPDLPDFRDDVYKYPKIKISSSENNSDLRNKFKEYTGNFGSTTANCIASVLDAYEINYTYDTTFKETSIRNCIKRFTLNDSKKLSYRKICNFKNQIFQALNDGYPVLFGFTVYESFNTNDVKMTGVVPIPKKDEKILGGICLIIVGYINKIDSWIVRHPFGNKYGDHGYLYISADILTKTNNSTTDFWTLHYD